MPAKLTSDLSFRDSPRAPRRVGRPSAQEASDLEKAVLQAALAEFRDVGFAGASIERIARMAGVTRSAVYRRHGDKRQLLERVLQLQIAQLEEQADAVILPSDDPLTALRRTAEAYCRFVISPTSIDLQRIVIWGAGARTRAEMPSIPSVPETLTRQVDRRIALAQDAALLRRAPPGLWRTVLLRLVTEGPRWEALTTYEPWTEDQIREDFDRMWDAFIAIAGA
ncbi:TetR/AcrR family transcriptional regulator [Novosphingobium sp. BL-52-GroH]|uniref:TetR/AcrR family transcriptional regulator n=1 Tax=Novosphingobium sp. BL-52-GroH TaxID=3349877 RepID=UPI0038512DB4